MASMALPPAFDQRHPARLNRLQTICLQTLSTTPESPCVRPVLDRPHPIRPFALAQPRGFHGGVCILDRMEQVEGEGRFLCGEGLLAGVADTGRPVGEALPIPWPRTRRSGARTAICGQKVRSSADAFHGLRAVNVDADRTAAPVLPRLPDCQSWSKITKALSSS